MAGRCLRLYRKLRAVFIVPVRLGRIVNRLLNKKCYVWPVLKKELRSILNRETHAGPDPSPQTRTLRASVQVLPHLGSLLRIDRVADRSPPRAERPSEP